MVKDKDQRNRFNTLLREIRSSRLTADINENKNDPKRIHQIVGNAMYINMVKPLPPEVNGVNLSEEFINQFQNKTVKIRIILMGKINKEKLSERKNLCLILN